MVFGGRILSGGDSKGTPGYIQIANIWMILNVGGGPTPDKPTVTLCVGRLVPRHLEASSGPDVKVSSLTGGFLS
jgi:hypothetical protein